MEVEEIVESEGSPCCADLDCSLHRPNVAEYRSGGAVGGQGLVGRKREPLVRRAQPFDE